MSAYNKPFGKSEQLKLKVMNIADKVKLKKMYLEEVGEFPPDTDNEYFTYELREYIGEREYKDILENLVCYEPDYKAINNYIEWLEQKVTINRQ